MLPFLLPLLIPPSVQSLVGVLNFISSSINAVSQSVRMGCMYSEGSTSLRVVEF
jgi:hypothetical protein